MRHACSWPGGDEKAKAFFRDLKSNDVQVLSGNKQVATAVGSGQLAFGLTDTDDAMGEVEAGSPVVIVYPDRKPDELGTLFIPEHAGPHQRIAPSRSGSGSGELFAQPGTEAALADGPSAPDPPAVDLGCKGPGRDAEDRSRDGRRL